MAFQATILNGPTLEVEVDRTSDPTTGSRTWTSITNKIRSVAWTTSGRNDEFERTSPGTATLLLDNRADAVTSLGLKKAQWLRIRTQWLGVTYSMWQGILTSIPRQWPSAGKDATLSVEAADTLYLLRLLELSSVDADMGFGGFPRQRVDERLTSIIERHETGGLTLLGTVDTDSDVLDRVLTPPAVGTDALGYALSMEASDNGQLVARADGLIDYRGRHWRYLNSPSSILTLGEGASECPYRDSVTYEDDDSRLANVVTVTPLAPGTPQVASDATSKSDYFQRRNSSADRELMSSDNELALSAAQYLLRRYKDPPPRIPQAEVDLALLASSYRAKIPTLLDLGTGDRVTWKRAAQTPISTDAYVEKISHEIEPGTSWKVTLQLSPVIAGLDVIGWLLGTGQLGSTAVLSY